VSLPVNIDDNLVRISHEQQKGSLKMKFDTDRVLEATRFRGIRDLTGDELLLVCGGEAGCGAGDSSGCGDGGCGTGGCSDSSDSSNGSPFGGIASAIGGIGAAIGLAGAMTAPGAMAAALGAIAAGINAIGNSAGDQGGQAGSMPSVNQMGDPVGGP
jgi:hypothetical protein